MMNIAKFISAIVSIIMFLVPVGIEGTLEDRYTNFGTIIEIEDEAILVEDYTGNVWEFEGTGFKINDKVKITFSANHTDNTRKDDKIIKVKKVEKNLKK